jgi:hypothetical protein
MMTASPTQSSTHPLAVYDGRRAILFIKQLGTDGYEALDITRKVLRRFTSLAAAADAVEGVS